MTERQLIAAAELGKRAYRRVTRGIAQEPVGTEKMIEAMKLLATQVGRIAVAFVYGPSAVLSRDEQGECGLLVVIKSRLTLAEYRVIREHLVRGLENVTEAIGRDVTLAAYSPYEFRDRIGRRQPFIIRVLAGRKLWVRGTNARLRGMMVDAENDFDHMQDPEMWANTARGFRATPEEMGAAAVADAKKATEAACGVDRLLVRVPLRRPPGDE